MTEPQMTLRDAVEELSKLGSDQDPIDFRGWPVTPEDLLYGDVPEGYGSHLHEGYLAKDIRITYFGGEPYEMRSVNGTLQGMVKNRRKLETYRRAENITEIRKTPKHKVLAAFDKFVKELRIVIEESFND